MLQDIPHTNEGFRLLFSASPFPKHQAELIWLKEEYRGNWYRWQQKNLEGWLCPALFKYFNEAPKTVYFKAESFYS